MTGRSNSIAVYQNSIEATKAWICDSSLQGHLKQSPKPDIEPGKEPWRPSRSKGEGREGENPGGDGEKREIIES